MICKHRPSARFAHYKVFSRRVAHEQDESVPGVWKEQENEIEQSRLVFWSRSLQ